MFTEIKIEAIGQTFEDGNGWITSDWREGAGYSPKPKTSYTIGGVPKRSVPNKRFKTEVKVVFTYDEYDTFKDFFYNSEIDYLTVTFGNNPMGRDTNILAMNFDGDIKAENKMANSIEVSFVLEEVLHVEL